jgi:hypothetical protein
MAIAARCVGTGAGSTGGDVRGRSRHSPRRPSQGRARDAAFVPDSLRSASLRRIYGCPLRGRFAVIAACRRQGVIVIGRPAVP